MNEQDGTCLVGIVPGPAIPLGNDPLKAAEVSTPELDMEQVREELFAALQSIEDLRHQHPYEATGYVGEPIQTIRPERVEGKCGR
ncbi:hypothetical protein AB0E67_27180 [Streptomyces sp. NPDC032161]|uniref:hypothetical protein n=1 Tax=unclassified Streptomyces TaxID=2593676 RepID=UPI0033F80B15